MSSDEEVRVGSIKQYHIRVPTWRSEAVTAWLRVFDILYNNARLDGLLGDHRGALPHARVITEAKSTSPRFVTRLPENAYDEEWLGQLIDYRTILRPRAPAPYHHTPTTLQYFEFTLCVVAFVLILLQACIWHQEVAWSYTVLVATSSLCLVFIIVMHLLLRCTCA